VTDLVELAALITEIKSAIQVHGDRNGL
jgi:hypothetical protein